MTDNICVAMTCFNREALYYRTLQSLHRMNPSTNLLIFDDASSSIDHKVTLAYFPTATIYKNSIPTGRADFAIFHCMRLAVESTQFDYVLLADSDLLFDKDIPSDLQKLLPMTDGFCSLFNTINHSGRAIDSTWLEKHSIGSAGCVFRRDILKMIVAEVPLSHRYDWDWSMHLKTKGIRLLCTSRSYIQHLGFFDGQNSSLISGDFGQNFYDYSDLHLSLVLEGLVDGVRLLAKQKS